MSVLYIVLPLALIFAASAVAIYVWAVRVGQFDDLQTPPQRMLLDDQPSLPEPAEKPNFKN